MKDYLKYNPWFEALLKLLKQIGLKVLIGLAIALLFLWLFVELSENLLENEFQQLDENFGNWVHSYSSPVLDQVFNFFTSLGNALGIIGITLVTFGLLIWRRHYNYGWLLLLAVGGGIIINQTMKVLFQRPRPQLWTQVIERPDSFSFPSGHATVAMCYFGVLLWLGIRFFRRPPAKVAWSILILFIIFMIGLSRIYLGVHYLTDVAGGYLSGGFWLLMLLNGSQVYLRLKKPRTSF
jgi:undecaprenyl-diphosphatase